MSQRRRYNNRNRWRKTYRNYSRFNPDNEHQYYQYGVVPVTADRYRREEAEEARADYYRAGGRSTNLFGYRAMQESLNDARSELAFYRNTMRNYLQSQRRSQPIEE